MFKDLRAVFLTVLLPSADHEVFLPEYFQSTILHSAHFRRVVKTSALQIALKLFPGEPTIHFELNGTAHEENTSIKLECSLETPDQYPMLAMFNITLPKMAATFGVTETKVLQPRGLRAVSTRVITASMEDNNDQAICQFTSTNGTYLMQAQTFHIYGEMPFTF